MTNNDDSSDDENNSPVFIKVMKKQAKETKGLNEIASMTNNDDSSDEDTPVLINVMKELAKEKKGQRENRKKATEVDSTKRKRDDLDDDSLVSGVGLVLTPHDDFMM